jgi:malate synthase
VWQQVHNHVRYSDTGNEATPELVGRLLDEESERLRSEVDASSFERYYAPARELIRRLTTEDDYVDFLTTPAYEIVA